RWSRRGARCSSSERRSADGEFDTAGKPAVTAVAGPPPGRGQRSRKSGLATLSERHWHSYSAHWLLADARSVTTPPGPRNSTVPITITSASIGSSPTIFHQSVLPGDS